MLFLCSGDTSTDHHEFQFTFIYQFLVALEIFLWMCFLVYFSKYWPVLSRGHLWDFIYSFTRDTFSKLSNTVITIQLHLNPFSSFFFFSSLDKVTMCLASCLINRLRGEREWGVGRTGILKPIRPIPLFYLYLRWRLTVSQAGLEFQAQEILYISLPSCWDYRPTCTTTPSPNAPFK